MRIKVKIADVEVVIERPNFGDDAGTRDHTNPQRRKSIMDETIIPTLKEATDKAKELYELKKQHSI